MSSSSDRDEREINEYHNESNSSSSSSECSGSESDSMDEQYSHGVSRVPLEVLQEEMKRKVAFGSFAGPSTSVQPSIPSHCEEVDIIYSCDVDILSKMDEKRLYMLRDKYQFPDEVDPRLAAPSERCCAPNSPTVGIYKAYLLGGLRLSLNSFARELLHRLDIRLNQLNPYGWRTTMAM